MACGPACVAPTPSQAHCSVCHTTFGGPTGFDKHRRHGVCADPATLGMADDGRGVWRKPNDRAGWWETPPENATDGRTGLPGR
jgi:hypothetical protein